MHTKKRTTPAAVFYTQQRERERVIGNEKKKLKQNKACLRVQYIRSKMQTTFKITDIFLTIIPEIYL